MFQSMLHTPAFIWFPRLVAVAVLAVVVAPADTRASEDANAEREARRIENEARRLQEQGRRDMEERERAQAEALRSQQDAIRRMEATQSRMGAIAQQQDLQSAEQARINSYPYPYSTPRAPAVPGTTVSPQVPVTPVQPLAPLAPSVLPMAPDVRLFPDRPRQDDPVSEMSFATLTDRLKTYFGTESGVLIVLAGTGMPFGLMDGDVVVSVDGRAPTDGPHLARILRSYQPGERVKLRVQRERRIIELDTAAPARRGN